MTQNVAFESHNMLCGSFVIESYKYKEGKVPCNGEKRINKSPPPSRPGFKIELFATVRLFGPRNYFLTVTHPKIFSFSQHRFQCSRILEHCSRILEQCSTITPSRHRLNLQKKTQNPKFHFGFLEKVQIWTKDSTHYPFSPPAEFTKKKSKVPLWIFRKGPNLDQKFDVLPLLATG